MADLPPDSDSTGDPRDLGVEPDRGSATGTPPWVWMLGIIIAIVVVLLLVLAHLTGAIGPALH